MKLKSFLKLVEIRTKTASVIPFLLGSLYAVYRFHTFNTVNFLLMAASLLCIDMTTTAVNNYQDYRRANRKEGYGYEKHNAIVRDGLSRVSVLVSISVLLVLAVVFGALLTLRTNLVVLLLGALSFAVGLLYSAGPLPISRTPFGELLSGSFMGFVIPFMAVYVHLYDSGLVSLTFKSNQVLLSADWKEVLFLLIISFPAVVGIGNIMLANNLCDMEDDLENRRYTLPLFIGLERGLTLFKAGYYAAYADILLAVLLGAAPPVALLSLLTFPLIYKNIRLFQTKQTKADTFGTSVANFAVMNLALILTIGVASLLALLF